MAGITPRYKRFEIEWKHFVVGGETCERCGNTGDSLCKAVEELRREVTPAGVKINLTETLVDRTRIGESNKIRLNGRLLENLLAASVVSTDCPSCGLLQERTPVARRLRSMTCSRYPSVDYQEAAYVALGMQ